MEGESNFGDSLHQSHNSPMPNTILFCSICDKPFTNEWSHRRHVRYCSTRKRHRPRSCLACYAAKVKCSFETPCSRCTKRKIECVYDGAAAAAKRALPKPSEIAQETSSRPNSMQIASFTNGLLHTNDRISTFTDHSDVDNGSVQLISSNSHILSELNTQAFSLPDFLANDELFMSGDDTWAQTQSLSDISVVSHNKLGHELPSWCTWTRQEFSLSVVTETPMVELDLNLKTIVPIERPLAQHSADLVIKALRSFPTMMLRRETFPWFIHPHSQLISRSKDNALPEALSNCMSIAHMFALRTSETKHFLWSTIRAECCRFVNEKHHLSTSEIFIALQACIIYLIMCIVDQSPESEKTSLELFNALHDLYVVIKEVSKGSTNPSDISEVSSNWGDWIFAESRRRFSNLWFLIGCVVCVKTGIACDPTQSYRHLPLPSPKSLWEAPTQSAWEMEYEACKILQTSGLVTMGDLIDAQKSEFSPYFAQKLDKWNAGVDNLGSLLNLARTMV